MAFSSVKFNAGFRSEVKYNLVMDLSRAQVLADLVHSLQTLEEVL